MGYCRLTQEERYQIQALISSAQSKRAIARQLGRNVSTISRECRGEGPYKAAKAHQSAVNRRASRYPKMRLIQGGLEAKVRDRLLWDWSPDQIAGRMLLENSEPVISHSTIYRYIERDKSSGGLLWKHLRILRRKHKDRKRPKWAPSTNRVPNRLPIDARPEIVLQRTRLGDYERDLVQGKSGKPALLTIVDRTSRLVKLGWMPRKSAEWAHKLTVSRLKNEPVKTITNDNGMEFASHQKTSKALGTPIYFSSSYRAWERGTNENTNGLLRQYFPRKRDIGVKTKEELRRIENLLNNRPRKILGYRTPNEIHQKLKRQVLR